MGKETFTRALYTGYLKSERGIDASSGAAAFASVTKAAEKQAISSGKLQTLVDPSSFNVVRLSLIRLEENADGKFELLVGPSMPIETRVDTTGSMGGNVDVALRVLPDVYERCQEVLPGYDIHICTGIFGDVSDKFPLCRPQFEMIASKICEQLTLMVPQRAGGDAPEDPDLGIFGGAYLCRHYVNRIGLKGYDFTITDAPGRGKIDPKELKRVYGDEVFAKTTKNGFSFTGEEVFELTDVWTDLLKRAHAFVLLIGSSAKPWWVEHVGKKRVIIVPNMEYVPYVQAVIIGLTEGTLTLDGIPEFLASSNMKPEDIKSIADAVVNIPLKAQAKLKNFKKKPKKGDLYAGKPNVWTDENIWPIGHKEEVPVGTEEANDWV